MARTLRLVLSALVALGVTEFRQPIEIPDAEGDGLARQGGVAAAEQTAPFRPFAGVTNAAGDVLTGNARVAFVDHDGDGTDALVFSVVDDVTDPFDAQVRITAFSLDTATGVATIFPFETDLFTQIPSGSRSIDSLWVATKIKSKHRETSKS